MQIARSWRLLRVACAVCSAWAYPTSLWAASLGSPILGGAGAALGQPLDFALPIRLDPGEQISPDCAGAEVVAGEHLIPAYELRVSLEPVSAELMRLRVLTLQGVQEPALTVVVHVGCPPVRQTRRFVVLVGPGPSPLPVVPRLPEPASAPAEPPVAALEVPRPLRAERERAGATTGVGTGVSAATPRTRPAAAATASATTAAVPRTPAPRASQPRLRLEALEPTAAGIPPVDAATSTPAVPVKAPEGTPVLASTALAAEAMAVAASAVQRSERLEQLLEQTRLDLRSSREQVSQLRERLAQDQQAAGWAWPLLLLTTLLAAVSLWLGRRVWKLQGQSGQKAGAADASSPGADVSPDTHGQPGWSPSRDPNRRFDRGSAEQQTRSRLATAPVPFVRNADADELPPVVSTLSVGLAPITAARPRSEGPSSDPSAVVPSSASTPGPRFTANAVESAANWAHASFERSPDAAKPESPMAITQPLSAGSRDLRSGSRDVSIEELIDLEQQAEFFIVLGQDDAAIDLLVDHLRGTGGTSPLPYLKLLEIYHRRSDQMAYERTRARFNHRFNAWAPQWGADLAQGRGLEDYPGVLPRLTQVWPRPLDAMAELEALLFRKSRGDLFELPAYREVLFLYALARDLLDREAADSGNVDLLLPLADGSPFGSTAPLPFQLQGAELAATRGGLRPEQAGMTPGADFLANGSSLDDRPTAPVDFDLSAPAPPSSIFDSPLPRHMQSSR